jgi:hypothetical protein
MHILFNSKTKKAVVLNGQVDWDTVIPLFKQQHGGTEEQQQFSYSSTIYNDGIFTDECFWSEELAGSGGSSFWVFAFNEQDGLRCEAKLRSSRDVVRLVVWNLERVELCQL